MRCMPTVLLVRHGQASFGGEDYDVLSEAGHRQAEVVAASLAERGYRADRLVCGTLRRQRETAAAFTALGAPDPEIEPRWDEYDSEDILRHHSESAAGLDRQGGAEQLTNRAFQTILESAQAQWIEHADRSPTSQPWPDFNTAGATALRDLATDLTSGQTAIVVTSGGTIAALLCALWDAPATLFPALNRVTVNASVTKLAVGSTGTNVISFNDHSHLESVDRALVTYR
jgi:broad specificity phosphatase PhoE